MKRSAALATGLLFTKFSRPTARVVFSRRAVISTFEGKPAGEEKLLSTGLTIPLGQTVVLGSAAPGGSNKALILAVRPDVAIAPRR